MDKLKKRQISRLPKAKQMFEIQGGITFNMSWL